MSASGGIILNAIDFTRQYLRIDRAEMLGQQLAAAIQAWSQSEPWELVPHIADDRLSWQLVLKVKQSPPLEEWSLLFGEAVHNLRSSLDNMTVNIARSAGVSEPKTLGKIQFPVSSTKQAWRGDRS